MCVNGIRCFAKYQFDQGRVSETSHISGRISIETTMSVVQVEVKRDESGFVTRASTTLPDPSFNPLDCGVTTTEDSDSISVQVDDQAIDLQLVSIGNPHAIHWLSEGHQTTDYELIRIGPRVERDATFREKTNFEIAELLGPNYIRARVWERGVGETLSCGSGACAVMASAHSRGLVDDLAVIAMPGGELFVEWSGEGPITLEGVVTKVFEATIES
jgi:diaminopimelate epimerase